MRLIPITTVNGVTALTRVTVTGTLTSGSAAVTGISGGTAQLIGALAVSGTGVPSSTFVYSIDSSSQVTLSQQATANGSQSLTFTLEPVTLAEAKLHARIEYPDDDALVAGLIVSARRYAETALRSALLYQQWTLFTDSFPVAGGYYNPAVRQVWASLGGMPSGLTPMPGFVPNSTGVIEIPLPPLVSIQSVNYYDTSGNFDTVSPSLYDVSLGMTGRIQPVYGKVWPLARPTIDAVQISFTAGRGATADTVEDNVKSAIKLAVAHWYENREWISGDGAFLTVPNTVDALLSASDPGIYA